MPLLMICRSKTAYCLIGCLGCRKTFLYTVKSREQDISLEVMFAKIAPNVKQIKVYTFERCKRLRYVDFSAATSLTEIHDNAFHRCQSLTTLKFPASLKKIGPFAFSGCFSLRQVEWNRGLEEIGCGAFKFCEQLRYLDFSGMTNLREIGEAAFADCIYLETLLLGPAITSIAEKAFSHCMHLKNVQWSQHLVEISSRAFEHNQGLESIDLSECRHLSFIGFAAFQYNTSLRDVKFGPNLTCIGEMAFYSCRQLQNLSSGVALEEIGIGAFAFCDSLKFINLHKVERISDKAFFHCKSLESVAFPDMLQSVGKQAFALCGAFVSASKVPSAWPPSHGLNAFYGTRLSIKMYDDSNMWIYDGTDPVPRPVEDVQLAPQCTKLYHSNSRHLLHIKTITLHNNLQEIGRNTFWESKKMKSIELPSSITYFEMGGAFNRSTIESIVLQGNDNFPLALRLFLLYPAETTSNITMDRLVDMYSRHPLEKSRVLSPQSPQYTSEQEAYDREIDLLEKIRQIWKCRVNGLHLFVRWCLETGLIK
eukprot:scaffold23506_cov93-Cylindrotheca_fusiformis.AAC.2